MHNAHDAVDYLGASPETFIPALQKITSGIQQIDPLTGKVTEQFKKAYNALKEWGNITFDRVAKRIQNLRKAVEGGFIDTNSLEREFRDVSQQLKLQIVTELQPTKGQYKSEGAYNSVLASEYISRLQDLGGDIFVEMARREFANFFDKTGRAMGAAIESQAKSLNTTNIELPQKSFDVQNFSQALSPIISRFDQLANKDQTRNTVDYSGSIALIITEIQNVKTAVVTLDTNLTNSVNNLENSIKQMTIGNNYNVNINQEGFTIQQKSDADYLARSTISALRSGIGNGSV